MTLSQADWNTIATMTRQGVPVPRIAQVVGVCERQVTRVRVKLGCAREIPEIPAEDLELARRLLEDGASYNEAARTIGCSYKRLTRRFPGYGAHKGSGGGQMAALMNELRRLETR